MAKTQRKRQNNNAKAAKKIFSDHSATPDKISEYVPGVYDGEWEIEMAHAEHWEACRADHRHELFRKKK